MKRRYREKNPDQRCVLAGDAEGELCCSGSSSGVFEGCPLERVADSRPRTQHLPRPQEIIHHAALATFVEFNRQLIAVGFRHRAVAELVVVDARADVVG